MDIRSLAATLCGRKQEEEPAEAPVDTANALAEEKRAQQQKEVLFEAIINCDLESIKKLKEECSFKDIKDIHDRTPLHVLVDIKLKPDCDNKVIKDIFDVLTEGAHGCNVNCVEKYGNTPLKLAAEKGCLQVLRCLLEKEADMNITDKVNRDTPLHWAAKNNMRDATALLSMQSGAHLNPQNKEKKTPLHLAVEQKHTNIVHRLLLKRVDKMVKDKNNSTPLDIAVRNGSQDIIELLEKPEKDLFEDARVKPDVRGQGEYVETDSGLPSLHSSSICLPNQDTTSSLQDTIPLGTICNSNFFQMQTIFNVTMKDNAYAAIGTNSRVESTYATSEALASPTSTTPPTSPTRIVFPTAPPEKE